MEDLGRLSATLISAATEASKVVKQYISAGFKVDMKGPANLVTEADLAAEKTIVEHIKRTFPDHSFLGEEKEKADIRAQNLWVIDPIDGTTNFTHGVPVVGISIAFSHKGEVIVGGVLNPFTDELYFAAKGQGATFNNQKIKVSSAKTINESLIATGFYYGLGPHLTSSLDIVKILIERECHGIRRMGAASMDLCYVARGLFGTYFELKLNSWDFAAGMLIVSEAGGTVTNLNGSNLSLGDTQVLACNGSLKDLMLGIIRQEVSA